MPSSAIRHSRRTALRSACATVLALHALHSRAQSPRAKHILLSNAWHNVNIGDIGHAPGMLRLIATHLPETTVTLWPSRALAPDVRAMLLKWFPRLAIIAPGGDEEGRAVSSELLAAIERADLFLLGSGGYHPQPIDIWRASTDKPYGVYGNAFGTANHAAALSQAAFVYCRDSVSLDVLKQGEVASRTLEFGPDSVFGLHVRDDQRASRYLTAMGLEPQRFIAVVPRLRYSPYHEIYDYRPRAEEQQRAAVNEEHKTADHAVLRELIVNWVRATSCRVLACPEMTYGVPLAKEQLVNKLPEDVRRQVVWRDSFWLCDEAASVYAQAVAVVSLDCHSPIITLAQGVPAIHVRLPTDTPKSRMFADIGLAEWVHEHAAVTPSTLTQQVLEIHERPEAARQKVAAAMNFVHARQAATFDVIRRTLGA